MQEKSYFFGYSGERISLIGVTISSGGGCKRKLINVGNFLSVGDGRANQE